MYRFREKSSYALSLAWALAAIGTILPGCDESSSTSGGGTSAAAPGTPSSFLSPIPPNPIEYAGISSSIGTSTTTATITFPSSAVAAYFNIYCKEARSTAAFEYIMSSSPSTTSANLTGLNSGTSYLCQVKAANSNGLEDGNTQTALFQTTSLTSTNYQGVLAVQAYGDAPTAPSSTPQSRVVIITWLPFASSTNTTVYSLVRADRAVPSPIDSTTTTPCTATTLSACLVCNKSGFGAQTCVDSNVATSPEQYDYAVVQNNSAGQPEELPLSGDAGNRIRVPIPPANMVLVQRDAANVEMCQNLLNKSTDPFNHQRCAYTGLGATPYNTNPGNAQWVPSSNVSTASPAVSCGTGNLGCYDIGYNFFVDRFGVGTPWTTESQGGMCGPTGPGNTATPGDCDDPNLQFTGATTPPSIPIGADGNVWVSWNAGYAYINIGGTWTATNAATTSSNANYWVNAFTNAPNQNHGVPPILDYDNSVEICALMADPNYGPKRMFRKREFTVSAAIPMMVGEPSAVGPSGIVYFNEYSAGLNPSCNISFSSGNFNYSGTPFTPDNQFAMNVLAGYEQFVIGSTNSSKCVSRFGEQDFWGNLEHDGSDRLINCSGVTHTCQGAASSKDSGNRDLENYNFDGVTGPGATGADLTTIGPYYTPTFGANFFSYPLGMPMAGTDGGNAVAVTLSSTYVATVHTDFTNVQSDYGYAGGVNNYPTRVSGFGGEWQPTYGFGRFTADFSRPYNAFFSTTTTRCVLPAE